MWKVNWFEGGWAMANGRLVSLQHLVPEALEL